VPKPTVSDENSEVTDEEVLDYVDSHFTGAEGELLLAKLLAIVEKHYPTAIPRYGFDGSAMLTLALGQYWADHSKTKKAWNDLISGIDAFIRARVSTSDGDWPEDFRQFWQVYPRNKNNKGRSDLAVHAFLKIPAENWPVVLRATKAYAEHLGNKGYEMCAHKWLSRDPTTGCYPWQDEQWTAEPENQFLRAEEAKQKYGR
jgi:hypothetical protein